jgi:putative membrane protein
MRLRPEESDAIDRRVAAVEARTGVQVVVAVVPRSDSYLELPWKACALGTSLAALGLVVADASSSPLLPALVILGAGAVCALLAIFVAPFARLFLRETHRHAAVKVYAEALFLRHELFATRDRMAVLLLVSHFERRVEILADTGLRGRVGEADWQRVIETMRLRLRDANPGGALEAGLGAVEAMLVSKGFYGRPGMVNELADHPIEERGR